MGQGRSGQGMDCRASKGEGENQSDCKRRQVSQRRAQDGRWVMSQGARQARKLGKVAGQGSGGKVGKRSVSRCIGVVLALRAVFSVLHDASARGPRPGRQVARLGAGGAPGRTCM